VDRELACGTSDDVATLARTLTESSQHKPRYARTTRRSKIAQPREGVLNHRRRKPPEHGQIKAPSTALRTLPTIWVHSCRASRVGAHSATGSNGQLVGGRSDGTGRLSLFVILLLLDSPSTSLQATAVRSRPRPRTVLLALDGDDRIGQGMRTIFPCV
jgi:hypothetical protein